MAYQPFPQRVASTTEFITNGTTPVTLATAGTDYVIWALAIKPTTPPITVNTERISMLTGNRPVECRLAFGLTFGGNPLVFNETEPNSLLTVAYGDGSQNVTSAFAHINGTYVPANDERRIDNPPLDSSALATIIPPSFVGYMVARSENNNAQVSIRAEFQIIKVDEFGRPLPSPNPVPAVSIFGPI